MLYYGMEIVYGLTVGVYIRVNRKETGTIRTRRNIIVTGNSRIAEAGVRAEPSQAGKKQDFQFLRVKCWINREHLTRRKENLTGHA